MIEKIRKVGCKRVKCVCGYICVLRGEEFTYVSCSTLYFVHLSFICDVL